MNTKPLEQFAQTARRDLLAQAGARLDYVLGTDSAELRGQADAIEQLQTEVRRHGRQAVIDRAAYTWFNRFCALRFMDANRYSPLGIVSPAPGHTQPEILAEAKAGHIDPAFPFKDGPQRVLDLLAGRAPSRDGQGEAYRLLLVAACNRYHTEMPFLFERIADWTELLLPDDLLSAGSVLHAARQTLTEEICQDVEVIGWLYQFYISEKKAEVDEKVKKGGKVEVDELAAKTSMYTTDWIVRYLVENSLGRLWLLNHPNSQLAKRMTYYIDFEHSERDFLRINSPEDIRLCDPACGSGHMLTYAFDLLYTIYEEEGYNPPDIPRLILSKNLTGLEIDERSGDLAAFALMMKGRARDRRFFSRGVRPDIVVLSPPGIDREELARAEWFRELGRTLLDRPLQEALLTDLHYLEQAGNLGSLIRPRLTPEQIEELRGRIGAADDLLGHALNMKVLDTLAQLAALVRPYHIVVANPPYLGKSMNAQLKKFAEDNYPDSKSDLFAMFIERGFDMLVPKGFNAMITMESWMFLSSYETMRTRLLKSATINSMVHMPYLGKGGTSLGINFGTAATIFRHQWQEDFKGHFSCVRYYETDDAGVPFEFPVQNERLARASAADFKKIPGSPIAYWVSDKVRSVFQENKKIGQFFDFRIGMATGKNEDYVRYWVEVGISQIGFGFPTRQNARDSRLKWFPYTKGGEFRKWSGNEEFIVDWFDDGYRLQNTKHPTSNRIWGHNFNLGQIFRSSICWTVVTSSKNSFRLHKEGFLFDAAAGLCQASLNIPLNSALGFLNSKICSRLLPLVNPTINLHPGYLSVLPLSGVERPEQVVRLLELAKQDWDSYETSWDFTSLPLLRSEYRHGTLAETYAALRDHWRAMTLEMQRLEEENNRIFIDAYGLQDELSPDVPLNEITLTCNPHYRYDSKKPDDELEALLLADTMREFISYAVGCLFGRYSLDKPGLVLADAGSTIEDYVRKVGGEQGSRGAGASELVSRISTLVSPDPDGVLPILDGDWFPDDIVGRFKRFLRATFGDTRYEENLAFIEAVLGRDIRSYFLREFYDHHVKTYKKRPIYWLFSSPNGSFNALIYLHRYRPDTGSVVLNDYLRDYRSKLESHRDNLKRVSVSGAATPREKTQALRELDKLEKTLAELREYESEILYPLATQRVELDLDDGVKVNYNKLGRALKKVTGLSE